MTSREHGWAKVADPRRTPNSRALAARVVYAVFADGRSVSQALPQRLPAGPSRSI